MGKSIIIKKEIKIRDVKKLWKDIIEMKTPVTIDLKKVESVDGAGLQLLIFLFRLTENFPEKYIIKDLSDKLRQILISFGINNKREVKK